LYQSAGTEGVETAVDVTGVEVTAVEPEVAEAQPF
jgi:hypothetical protein